MRVAQRQRRTKETDVTVRVDLDGAGRTEVSTGIPFFDHMVEQLGRHGGFDLSCKVTGDLEVDAHHTVEDTGLTLGAAIAEALGEKVGVRRFASGHYPLDEALVLVALDLSGRPYLTYEVETAPQMIGTFDPQLAEEFWRAFVTTAGITLHLKTLAGRNGHHILEACFKGVARSLRDAVRVEGDALPSTKGTLST